VCKTYVELYQTSVFCGLEDGKFGVYKLETLQALEIKKLFPDFQSRNYLCSMLQQIISIGIIIRQRLYA
jgi:hypothetical protein